MIPQQCNYRITKYLMNYETLISFVTLYVRQSCNICTAPDFRSNNINLLNIKQISNWIGVQESQAVWRPHNCSPANSFLISHHTWKVLWMPTQNFWQFQYFIGQLSTLFNYKQKKWSKKDTLLITEMTIFWQALEIIEILRSLYGNLYISTFC